MSRSFYVDSLILKQPTTLSTRPTTPNLGLSQAMASLQCAARGHQQGLNGMCCTSCSAIQFNPLATQFPGALVRHTNRPRTGKFTYFTLFRNYEICKNFSFYSWLFSLTQKTSTFCFTSFFCTWPCRRSSKF